jgi:hypothetical protein
MQKGILLAVALAMAACGGNSEWVDPTTGHFSQQDSADVSRMFQAAAATAALRPPGPQVPGQPRSARDSTTETFHDEQACSAGGTQSADGTLSSGCSSSGTCSYSSDLHTRVSNCATGDGLLSNGSLDLSVRGQTSDSEFSFSWTMRGAMTVYRDGSLIGTCGVNVTGLVKLTNSDFIVKFTGTVCGNPIDV